MGRIDDLLNQAVDHAGEREVVAICFQQFAPYHVDRIAAVHRALGGKMRVFGVEYSNTSTTYAWERANSEGFERITLFPSGNWETMTWMGRLRGLVSCLLRIKAKHVFLINYQLPDTFLCAVLLRLLGKSPYVMMGSKFSDKDRFVWKEVVKKWLFTPYFGGITSGELHSRYLEFLGVGTQNFRTGLDTLSLQRVREISGGEPAPGGQDYHKRHFTIVARMVPEKDLPTAVRAYARYCEVCEERGLEPRDLVLCGDGPERGLIERIVQQNNVRSVRFFGFATEREVCETLATSLALILPSVSETWGLVINEAIAMGVPVLCSDVCGARDELVRSGVNGFSFAPGEVEGLANLMMMVSSEEDVWRQLSAGSSMVAPQADATRFARAVASVVQPRTQVKLLPEVPDVGIPGVGARGIPEGVAVEGAPARALQVAGE
ncbi:MAG: glycosyltransferase [Rhodospirillales bacterium]